MPTRSSPSLSVVVVTYNSREPIGLTLPALAAQLRAGDELIVVDNCSTDGTAEAVRQLVPEARVIESEENLGFAGGCNAGARAASGELLVLLNPDAAPASGWREAIELPYTDGREWSAWQALVTAGGGELVNTRGGVVHFTGIAWAGDAGTPLAELPAAEPLAREDPGFVSGACLAIPRESYARIGGLAEGFFLYHEDVDISLRLRLAGGRLGVEPAARVDHDYEFEKGGQKWRLLERNRWATLIRTYPGTLLALLFPALLATELAIAAAAIAGGWFGQKLRAWVDTLGGLPRLVRERRAIQATREVSTAEFAAALTPALESAYLGRAADSPLLARMLAGYWSLVVRLLGSRG